MVELRHDKEEKGSIYFLSNGNSTSDILASQGKGATISLEEEISLKTKTSYMIGKGTM